MLLTHTLDGQIPALKDFPREDRPNSTVVFWTFRLMVGLGVLMILLGAMAAWAYRRGRLHTARPLLRFALAMGPAGLIAILAGWCTTEIGRQPWVVYGVMRTADAVSPHSLEQVALTLAIFVVVYLLVFGAGTVYLLRIIGKGPVDGEGEHTVEGGPGEMRHPMRPLSGAPEGFDASPVSPTTGH